MRKTDYTILKTNETGSYLNFPIFLECSADEMGIMSSFNGDIEQIEQLSNFSYTQTGSTIQVYNTVNPDKLRVVLEQTFTINWGDGTTSGLTVNNGVVGSNLPSVSKTYSTNGQYEITISNSSPWSTEVLKKKVTIPRDISISDEFGYFTGYTLPGGTYQRYLYGYEYETGSIGITTGKTFTFMAIGKSRLGEFRNYGTSSFSTEIEPTPEYTGYTIDGLYYMDFPDGYTKITGSVPNYIHDLTGSTYTGYTYNSTGGTETFKFNKGSGSYFTTEYLDETDITNYIINHRLTRNEHFLGFIDDPQVYSDIFVERGKQGVMEKNLRLGEIDNMNELEIYGNGYFKIRKS